MSNASIRSEAASSLAKKSSASLPAKSTKRLSPDNCTRRWKSASGSSTTSSFLEPSRLDNDPARMSFDRYLTIHDATLRAFDHFIENNSTTMWSDAEGEHFEGRLSC